MTATADPVAPRDRWASPIDLRIDRTGPRPVLDLCVPVHNEDAALAGCVGRLVAHLRAAFPYSWRVTIADNASTDTTWSVARHLASTVPGVRAVHLPEKGRGRALRAVWGSSDAQIVAYTDADLSTDLKALLPLVAPLASGHSDLAIGSRLTRSAQVVRGPKREAISRLYNTLLHLALRSHFSDAQCGFKAVRASVARALLPQIENDNWFFDTELLVLAEHHGLRIHEVPVDWVDDPDTRVRIVATALEDLRGIVRVWRRIVTGRFSAASLTPPEHGSDAGLVRQLLRFATIGVLTTVLHVAGFLLLRSGLGVQAANAVSLVVATVVNAVLNRRVTFGFRGSQRATRDYLETAVVFLATFATTALALHLVGRIWPTAPTATVVGVLLAANALATLIRFLGLRAWVFNPTRRVRVEEAGP